MVVLNLLFIQMKPINTGEAESRHSGMLRSLQKRPMWIGIKSPGLINIDVEFGCRDRCRQCTE